MKKFLLVFSMLLIFQISFAEDVPHPADTNKDFKLTTAEFNAYNTAWLKKQSWPEGPSPVPMDYLTRAGFLVTGLSRLGEIK